MIQYQPIFKGKPAEYSAWEHTSAAVRSTSIPLFEVAPNDRIEDYLRTFVTRLSSIIDKTSVVVVDAAAVDQSIPVVGGQRAIEYLGAAFAAEGTPMRPVVRLSDSAVVLGDAALVAAAHGHGVTVRLGDANHDPDIIAFEAALPGLLASLGVGHADLHVLLDFQYIANGKDLARALPNANTSVAWLSLQPTFGSVFLAAGSFPSTISDMPTGSLSVVPRLDAAMYSSAAIPSSLTVGFADYAVNHPASGPTIPRAPLPSLRYLTSGEWLVWREKKSRPGNESFFTVCSNIVVNPGFSGSTYSWGDAEIARAAASVGGAGTATQWRSFATSHHLEMVVDRLAILGAP